VQKQHSETFGHRSPTPDLSLRGAEPFPHISDNRAVFNFLFIRQSRLPDALLEKGPCELWNSLDSSWAFTLFSLFVFFLEFQMIDSEMPGARVRVPIMSHFKNL
jgi:hypothetical protein